MRIRKRLLVLILAILLTFTMVGTTNSNVEATTYLELPTGKNYIDSANVRTTFSYIMILDEIAVKPNTDYVISFPFNDVEAFFEEEGFTAMLLVEGPNALPYDETLNGGNYEMCSVDVPGYLSCAFNTGSTATLDAIALSTNGDSSMAWGDSTLMQLEEGTVGTTYEAFVESASDEIAPVISGGPGLILSDVDNPKTVAYIISTFTAEDDNDGVISITTESDLYTGNEDTLGDYIVVIRATDSSGNYAELTLTVRVSDIVEPVINLIGDSTVYIEYPGTYSELGANVTDNYDTGISPVITDNVNTSILGTYWVHYDYTDTSTNAADQVLRTVIVRDTTAPVQTLSGDSTVYVEFGSNYTELGASWTDAFDGSGSSTLSGSVNVGVLDTYTITYNITDSNGNVATTLTRTVIVRDTTGPVFVGSTTYNWSNSLGYNLGYLMSLITASDLYSGDLTDEIVVQSDTFTGNILVLGTYTVVLRATDSSGNFTDMTITINVIDDTPPQFSTTLTILTMEYANSMTQQDIIDYFNNQ